MNNGGLFYYFYFRKEQIFIIKFSNYNDIKNIIEKGLPRVIYLPWYIAKRLGDEVYINLLSHERFQCQRKLINDESISVLPIDEYDFLLSLISIAKEPENYIKVRGKYFNTDDELLNDYRKYNTQALILSNYDISDMNINNYSGLDLLLNNIINQLDIKNEKYYEWINTTKDILVASNKKISLDEEGNIYSTNKINGKMKEIYTLKELMQYKFFIKNN